MEGLEVTFTRLLSPEEPEDRFNPAELLSLLGFYFFTHYEQTRDLEDLEAAIRLTEKALAETPEDHPIRIAFFDNLGNYSSSRYERTGNLQDLEAAINHAATVVGRTPEDHPTRPGQLNTLGRRLGSLYERTGNLRDLEAAIKHEETALNATPLDQPHRQRLLENLGYHLADRYVRTGNLDNLEAAINYTEVAVKETPEDHPDRVAYLNSLGTHLSTRFARTRNSQDLKAAMNHGEAALNAIPEDHPARPKILINLGNNLGSRYEQNGNLEDLEDAINLTATAIKAVPDHHPDRPKQLDSLGKHLGSRYERTGNMQDLKAAIDCAEIVVGRTPEDHPARPGQLNTLGSRLGSLYERTGNFRDLEDAIGHGQTALNAIPEDHPNRPRLLGNLGNRLSSRYERTGNLEDLEAAIKLVETAISTTPQDHPNYPRLFNNLRDYLKSRYVRTGNLQDLESAITYAKTALKSTPEHHPDRAIMSYNLADCLNSQYNQTRDLRDLDLAISEWLACCSIATVPTSRRILAASIAARMLVFSPLTDVSRAFSLLHDATHLIPLATSRSLERDDQQYILQELPGVTSLAVAVSLQAGKSPLEALRLQELGRSVTNGQLLDYRSEISDLMAQHPTLAKDFDSLRQELDPPFASISSIEGSRLSIESSSDILIDKQLQIQQAAFHWRNKAATDLDDILQQIRQKPGFETFLREESEEYFSSAAQEGPIVVLNTTKLRSDALLLTKEEVTSIPLPHLSHASTVRYLDASAASTDNKVKREMLEWLWKAAVRPVLRELGFYPEKVEPLPRIWWIGVGLLAQAPIHAAAKYKEGSIKMTTLQYCLPSYTSTIRALQYSRSKQQHQQLQNASMLIVTMPKTPGASPLGVAKEANEIKYSLRDLCTVETLEEPTAKCVLQALSGYSIAHFACHGVSSINPADSHLLLLAGTGDIDRLRVKDIAALKLPVARLAYLSACSTASNTTPELADEVTHIVSSFHIAGFINVIGALWPAQDEACQKMAAEFYSTLSKTDNVIVSYRSAVLRLMEQKPLQPIYWAPFIHFGA
ncbi:CHAT domain-containing protein [Terfezia claveryi]|nr:CHAT domain-containing protein [Terfezia claveryi]